MRYDVKIGIKANGRMQKRQQLTNPSYIPLPVAYGEQEQIAPYE